MAYTLQSGVAGCPQIPGTVLHARSRLYLIQKTVKVVLPTGLRGRRFGISCGTPPEDLQGRSRCFIDWFANACLIDVALMSTAK